MNNTSINSGSISSTKRVARLAHSSAIVLAVAVGLILLSSAMTHSKAMRRPEPAFGTGSPVQSQTGAFYLHGTGPDDNPPTLFLNTTVPSASSAKFRDSASITRNGGNLWKEVGTWTAAASMIAGTLSSLTDLHVWLGLKNSDDQGTNFDVRVEAYKNSTLMTSGQALCVTGVTRNPSSAKEVIVAFGTFSGVTFNGSSDALSLKILTRVGTDSTGASCGGHSNAVGLRLYFDATTRPSRFSAIQQAMDVTPPVLNVTSPADGSITSSTTVNVAGTVTDVSQVTVTANGTSLTVSNGAFNGQIALAEGANQIRVVATDSSGNQSERNSVVTRDTTPPELAVYEPREGAVYKLVTIAGTWADATPVTLTVNGVPVQPADRTFTGQLSPPMALLKFTCLQLTPQVTGVKSCER